MDVKRGHYAIHNKMNFLSSSEEKNIKLKPLSLVGIKKQENGESEKTTNLNNYTGCQI